MEVPNKIYKYQSFEDEFNLQNLENNIIYMSNPKKFNDPFEFNVPFKFYNISDLEKKTNR